jgi:hypothetical protein
LQSIKFDARQAKRRGNTLCHRRFAGTRGSNDYNPHVGF